MKRSVFGRKALYTPGCWSPNKAAARPSPAVPSLMLFLSVSKNWLFQSTCSGVLRIQLKKYYASPFIAYSIFTPGSSCSPGRGIYTPWVMCVTQNCLAHRQSAEGGALSKKSEHQTFEVGTWNSWVLWLILWSFLQQPSAFNSQMSYKGISEPVKCQAAMPAWQWGLDTPLVLVQDRGLVRKTKLLGSDYFKLLLTSNPEFVSGA